MAMANKNNRIDVSLAENDERGNPSGKVFQIDFTIDNEIVLRLDAINWEDGEECQSSKWRIDMYGFIAKSYPRQMWAGNMMWNNYPMPADYAIGFVNLLIQSKRFSATEGWTDLYEKFNGRKEISAQDFELDESIQATILNSRQTILELNPQHAGWHF